MTWILWWVLGHWLSHLLLAFLLGSLSTLGFLYLALQGKLGSRLDRYEKQFDALRTITEHAMDRGSQALKKKASKFRNSRTKWRETAGGAEVMEGEEETISATKVAIEPIVPVQIVTESYEGEVPVRKSATTENVSLHRRQRSLGGGSDTLKRRRRGSDLGAVNNAKDLDGGHPTVSRDSLSLSSPAGMRRHDGDGGQRVASERGQGRKNSRVSSLADGKSQVARLAEEKKRKSVYSKSVAIVTRRRKNGHKRTTSASAPITSADLSLAGMQGSGVSIPHPTHQTSPRGLARSPSSPTLSDMQHDGSPVRSRGMTSSSGLKGWSRRKEGENARMKDESVVSREASTQRKERERRLKAEKEKEKLAKERERKAEKERERAEKEREKEEKRVEKERERAEKEREKEEKRLEKETKKSKRNDELHTEGGGEETEEICEEGDPEKEAAKKGKGKSKRGKKKTKNIEWIACEVSDWCPELANSAAHVSKASKEGKESEGGESEASATDSSFLDDDLRGGINSRAAIGREVDRCLQQRFLEAPLIHCGWMKIKTSLRRYRYRWFAVKAGIVAVYTRPFSDTGLLNATAIMLLTPDCSVCYKISSGGEFRLSVRSPHEKMFAPRGFTGARLTGYETSMLSNKKRHCKLSLQSLEKGKTWASALVKAIQVADEMEEVVTYLRTRKIGAGPSASAEEEKALAPDGLPHSLSVSGFSDISSDTNVTAKSTKPTKARLPKGLMSQVMMSGWLKLETAASKGSALEWVWIKRWCIVYKGIVVVFTSPDAKECSAMINLWNCSIRASPELAPKYPSPNDSDSEEESDEYLSLEDSEGEIEEESSGSEREGEYATDEEDEEYASEVTAMPSGGDGEEVKKKRKKKTILPKGLMAKRKSKQVSEEEVAKRSAEKRRRAEEKKRAREVKKTEREERKAKEKEAKTAAKVSGSHKRSRSSSTVALNGDKTVGIDGGIGAESQETATISEREKRREKGEREKGQREKGERKKGRRGGGSPSKEEETEIVEASRLFELISSSQQSGDVAQLIKKLPDFNRAAQYQIHEALCRYQSQTTAGAAAKSLSELVDEADPVPTKAKFSKFTKKAPDAAPLGHKVTIDGARDQRLLRFLAPSAGEAKRWLDALSSAASANYWEFPLEFVRITGKAREAKKESADWLNNFLDRYFAEMVNSQAINEKMFNWLQRKLDQLKKPDILGPIVVQNVDLGSSLLRTTGISLEAHQNGKELIGECDVVYQGGASVHLFTEVYLNWPTRQFISVPVEATVTMSYASGKLGLYIPPLLMGRATVTFLELPNTVFNTNVDIGGSKRYNVASLFPQITEFLQASMQKLLWKTLVMPNRMTFALGIPENSASLRLDRVASRPKGQAAANAASAGDPL